MMSIHTYLCTFGSNEHEHDRDRECERECERDRGGDVYVPKPKWYCKKNTLQVGGANSTAEYDFCDGPPEEVHRIISLSDRFHRILSACARDLNKALLIKIETENGQEGSRFHIGFGTVPLDQLSAATKQLEYVNISAGSDDVRGPPGV